MLEKLRSSLPWFKTPAEKVIEKALQCKTLADLIAVQPVVVLQYRRGNLRVPGKFGVTVDYLRRGVEGELIAPRTEVAFYKVPSIDHRELPKYALFIKHLERWTDTQLLVVAGEENSTPMIVHKSEHFGMFNPINEMKEQRAEQVHMSQP